ncbi:CubicO group peptidase (beta-lactamase class C family) [Cytobacillus purgationiresistens]|uniref:CubicO group peptidase (Beta-lactamase class C family) n=2 Tax=Cytobacillus purgationiresistens TaxID=863449 RepID=A0ABU0AR39_9BACI|nr:CubicO group peptidase (beta-lactamase class C family) [Cytobacillus purgationiresistens]
MKMKRKIKAIIFCGLFIFPQCSAAQDDECIQNEQYEDSVFSKVDAYITGEMKRQQLPGLSLGIVKDDRILYLKGYGHADPSGRPVTPDTPFGLGSISKSFTAMAVLQLAEEGKIDLDAPVQRYLQGFQYQTIVKTMDTSADTITVRHLLNQTSGFSQISTFSNTLSSRNDQDALEQNAMSYAEKFLHQANIKEHSFRYSNANYVLLGYIVQQISGQSYGDYVKEHIFRPLSMKNSFITHDEAIEHGLATPYRRIFGYNVAYEGPYIYIPGDLPAGYLYSSAKDMSHYLISQINGGRFENDILLSPEGIELMQTEPVPGTYAMGWQSDNVGGFPVIGHPGGSIGFQSQTWIVPEQKLGVIVFANVLDAIDTDLPKTDVITTTHIASGIINILNDQPIGEVGLSIPQKYLLVNVLMLLLSAWLLYTIARTAKRCLWKLDSDNLCYSEVSFRGISKIVLYFASLMIILVLSVTQVVPIWHIATIYQPDVILWVKIMAALLSLKGCIEIIGLVRSIRKNIP